LPLMLNVLNDVPALRSMSGQLYTLMAELFSNAFEHGVLGLRSELKNDAAGFAEYYRLRGEAMEKLSDGEVKFEFDHKPSSEGGTLSVIVQDSGKGFDYKSKKENQFNSSGYSGRGIPLIRTLCDTLTYSGDGNIVTVTLSWQREHGE